jgi:hypothetical protein
MGLFSNIFGLNGNSNSSAKNGYKSLLAEPIDTLTREVPIQEEMDIAEEPKSEVAPTTGVVEEPSAKQEPESAERLFLPTSADATKPSSKVAALVNKSHYNQGWIDGRYKHSKSIRLENEQAIIQDLALAIKERIEEITRKIQEGEAFLQELDEDFDAEHIAVLACNINNWKGKITSFTEERDLVLAGEGLATKPLTSYRRAYHEGRKAFFSDHKLLTKFGLLTNDENPGKQ